MCLKSVFASPLLRQTWASQSVFMGMLGTGMSLGFTLILLQGLRTPGSTIRPSTGEASWIASIIGGTMSVGAISATVLMTAWGRRVAVAANAVLGGLGWLLLFLAGDVPTLIIGRALVGVHAGSCLTLGTILVGEYTSPKNRGVFLALKASFIPIGSMFVHFLTNFLDWRSTALVSTIPYVLALFIVLTCPDTPAWLVTENRIDQARQAFIWLRGDEDDDAQKEFIAFVLAQKTMQTSLKMSKRNKIATFIGKFKRRDFLIPVGVTVISAVLMETSGRFVIPSYIAEFVRRIGAGRLDVFTFTMIMDIVTIVSSLVSPVCMRLFSRRGLLFASGFAGLGLLMIACLYLLLVARGVIPAEYSLISMVLILAYVFIINLSCANLCIVLIGEIFPLIHKREAASVVSVVFSLKVQLMLLITPILLKNVDVYGTFFLFGLVSLLCLIALWRLLPETHNKTLQEIEDGFMVGGRREVCRDVTAGAAMLQHQEDMKLNKDVA